VDEEQKRKKRTKSRVRAKVEWPFRILKRVFGYTKVRYRGIVKNHHWHLAAFALVNLSQHRRRLARWGRSVFGGRQRPPQTLNETTQIPLFSVFPCTKREVSPGKCRDLPQCVNTMA
jgi:hypothetical protein